MMEHPFNYQPLRASTPYHFHYQCPSNQSPLKMPHFPHVLQKIIILPTTHQGKEGTLRLIIYHLTTNIQHVYQLPDDQSIMRAKHAFFWGGGILHITKDNQMHSYTLISLPSHNLTPLVPNHTIHLPKIRAHSCILKKKHY